MLNDTDKGVCRECLNPIWSPKDYPRNCQEYCCKCCPDANRRSCARDIRFGNPLEQIKKWND